MAQDYYGKTAPHNYLSGRFFPAKHEYFINISLLKIPVKGGPHYLRREASEALKKLYTALKRDLPGVDFWIQSSTRSWYDQKYIWESKWNGRRLVGGVKLNKVYKDKVKRALKILEYSSMPGTSRHHWGTDFDINILNNEYYKTGRGARLYRWMRENAGRFGFCQPYTFGREKGYMEERWHWSYMPLAGHFLRDWLKYFSGKDAEYMEIAGFAGADAVWKLSAEYVLSINQDCK